MSGRDLGAIYTREWYEHDFPGLQPEFDLVAKGLQRWAVSRNLFGTTALDVGCGPGMLVKALLGLGWATWGFDGSPHAIGWGKENVPGFPETVRVADVLANPKESQVEIVICTEVAEHIPAEDAPQLVRFLVEHAIRAVVMTAARPGQGGHDHVNEQHPNYWERLFAEHGWTLDKSSTRELARRWAGLRRLSHMARNVLVFR